MLVAAWYTRTHLIITGPGHPPELLRGDPDPDRPVIVLSPAPGPGYDIHITDHHPLTHPHHQRQPDLGDLLFGDLPVSPGRSHPPAPPPDPVPRQQSIPAAPGAAGPASGTPPTPQQQHTTSTPKLTTGGENRAALQRQGLHPRPDRRRYHQQPRRGTRTSEPYLPQARCADTGRGCGQRARSPVAGSGRDQCPARPHRRPDTPTGLTDGERTILHYCAKGYDLDQIAGATTSTLHAVKKHLGSIYRKLGAQTPDQAVANARGHRLLDQAVIECPARPHRRPDTPHRAHRRGKNHPALQRQGLRPRPDRRRHRQHLPAVRQHLSRIYRKLGAQTPDEAVANAHGHRLLDQAVINALPAPTADLTPPTALTDGERTILHYSAKGYDLDQIAGATTSTLNAVRKHLSNIYRKLGGKTPDEAVANAHGHGLLDQAVINALPAPGPVPAAAAAIVPRRRRGAGRRGGRRGRGR